MKARIDWKVRSAPRPGVGVGLLGFCVWVFVMLLWACWVTLKVLVIGIIAVVAAVADWLGKNRHWRG